MPDISMCKNTDCPVKERCYRYVAIPNKHGQWYTAYTFKIDEKGRFECKSFVPVDDKSK